VPTPAQRRLLAERQALAAQTTGDGAITGVAQAGAAAPAEGICVMAIGPSGVRPGITRSDGRFLIYGLRRGWYSLQYRDCGHPGRYLPQWYGGTMTRSGSRPVLVSGAGLAPVAPVTLRLAGSGGKTGFAAPSADPVRSLLARVRAGMLAGQPAPSPASAGPAPSTAPANGGRISGRVTDQQGHPLAGICVFAEQPRGFGYAQARTGLRGYYTTANLPPGRYIALFYAGCGNSGNWLTQIYRGTYNFGKATIFTVRARKTTSNINAVLRLGGEISGAVTNAAGRKLSNICVYPFATSNAGQYLLLLPTASRNGVFHVRGVPAGSYRLLFTPCSPGSSYATVWWKNSVTPQHARLIRVKDRQRVSGISQVIPIGGKITGAVTAGTPHGTRLAGICVAALPSAPGITGNGFTATRADGTYVLRGLSAGSYQVLFSPGCGNNGNYLSETYPGRVRVTYGQVTTGINGVLPLGAQISGAVTDSRGHPVGGICVTVQGNGPGGFFGNGTQTAANGSYAITQLAAGNYAVQFSGGCGNLGSYAPQGYHGTNVNAPQEITVRAGQQLSGIDAQMQPGATISGRVTSSSRRGLDGVCVVATTPGIEHSSGFFAIGGVGVLGLPGIAYVTTAGGGRYEFSDLQPGQYELAFSGCGAKGDLAAQWYSGRRGVGAAAIIYAGAGHPTAGIDVVLQAGGAISGTIRSATGRNLPGACVQVTDLNRSVQLPVDETCAFGRSYQLSGLPPGAYHVTFNTGGFGLPYATQWYSRKASPAGAARVIIRAGRTTGGIDAALTVGGSISGQVTSAATRAALGNVCVFAQNVAQPDDFGYGFTNGQGRYVIEGLNSGRYDIEFSPCSGATLAGLVRPSLVTVVAPRQTRGINAVIPVGGSIQGHVTSGLSAAPGQALCVDAFGVNGGFANSGVTDAAGLFRITNLPPGRYLVYVGDPACPFGPYNVVPQWYSGKRSRAGATPVTVTGGAVTSGIDANLALDGSITGTVTGPGGAGLTGVCVSAVGADRATPVITETARGRYAIAELTPGRYRVEFYSGCGASSYATQWWRNADSARTATVITVKAGSKVTGISAALRR
jgi:hypothetical protein